jgi:hypothetical protein
MAIRHTLVPLLSVLLAAASACTTHVSYLDPVGYCAAVGTINHPDGRYDGPASPEWIADALTRIQRLGPATTDQAVLPVAWRCAGGSVVACSYGFGMDCDERADTSRLPSKATLDFCRAFPDVGQPLPDMGPSPSIYAWGCRAGWPHIIGLRRDVDGQGYLLRYWRSVTPGAGFSAGLDCRRPNAPPRLGSGTPARSKTCAAVSPT